MSCGAEIKSTVNKTLIGFNIVFLFNFFHQLTYYELFIFKTHQFNYNLQGKLKLFYDKKINYCFCYGIKKGRSGN